tara:strand:+ start:45 stop:338 length:294 start_codon:yes stop_codon:yes gene_type:complete
MLLILPWADRLMPSDHISNTDYHDFLDGIPTNECFIDYEALKLQKINLQHRCASYRMGLEFTLKWLKANTDIHPATTISNLAENSVWAKLSVKDDLP